jgi:hypothetical protein
MEEYIREAPRPSIKSVVSADLFDNLLLEQICCTVLYCDS